MSFLLLSILIGFLNLNEVHSNPPEAFDLNFVGTSVEETQITKAEDLDKEIEKLLRLQKHRNDTDRLVLNRKLNQCQPSSSGSALIIAFSGTGSYQPRLPILMDQVCKSIGHKLHLDLKKNIYSLVSRKFHEAEKDLPDKWSGLLAGPMEFLCNNPDLLPYSYDWYSFPSEESELLDDPAKLSIKEFLKLPKEIKSSFAAFPAGIQNAVQCTKKYLGHKNSIAGRTKLIVLSHSSGGRSAIKYLEKLQELNDPRSFRKPIKADLVFTIDPVREAHEAIAEALSQMAGNPIKKAYNFLPLLPKLEVDPVYVWSREQRESLYKTSNTIRHINVFQKADQLGLKMKPKFGIHGSRIYGADLNLNVTGKLGDDGHGAINYHPEVLELFKTELKRLYQ